MNSSFLSVKPISFDKSFCETPRTLFDAFYCTFWMYITHESIDSGVDYEADQELAKKCLNLENGTTMTTSSVKGAEIEATSAATGADTQSSQ